MNKRRYDWLEGCVVCALIIGLLATLLCLFFSFGLMSLGVL